MKKILFIISALTILATASAVLLLPENNIVPEPNTMINKNNSPSVDAVAKEKNENTYLIKKYGEKIGVFRKGAGKPFCIIDTFVFTLPQKDKAILTNGFTIYETELGSIVEDYTG